MHLGPLQKQDWVIWNFKIRTEIQMISAEASLCEPSPLNQWQMAPTLHGSNAIPQWEQASNYPEQIVSITVKNILLLPEGVF